MTRTYGLLALLASLAGWATSPAAAQAQQKPLIGIVRITYNNQQLDNLRMMIESALIATNRFRVISVSQAELDSRLDLQNNPNRSARGVGPAAGVDFFVQGMVTNYGTSNKSLFPLSCVQSIATLSLDLRVIDMKTMEYMAGPHMDKKANGPVVCGETATSQAPDAASMFRPIADEIASNVVFLINPISVVAMMPNGNIILNYGDGVLKVGEQMEIKQVDYIQTSTGRERVETPVGQIEVTSLSPRTSIAKLVRGCAAAVGHVAVRTAAKVRPMSERDRQRQCGAAPVAAR